MRFEFNFNYLKANFINPITYLPRYFYWGIIQNTDIKPLSQNYLSQTGILKLVLTDVSCQYNTAHVTSSINFMVKLNKIYSCILITPYITRIYIFELYSNIRVNCPMLFLEYNMKLLVSQLISLGNNKIHCVFIYKCYIDIMADSQIWLHVPNMVIVNVKVRLWVKLPSLNTFQPICNYMLFSFPILGSWTCELK